MIYRDFTSKTNHSFRTLCDNLAFTIAKIIKPMTEPKKKAVKSGNRCLTNKEAWKGKTMIRKFPDRSTLEKETGTCRQITILVKYLKV